MPTLPPTRPDLDTLLDTALGTAAETVRYDFKEILDLSIAEHKLKLVRAVGAFTNTDEGGFIIIGIADDRSVTGLADDIADQYDQTPVQRILNNYLAPAPRVLVRQHVRDQKRLVIVEIEPFEDIPSVVTRSEGNGRAALQAGTFVTRCTSAESKLLTTEVEIRRLADAIVRRRAQTIVELIQRGSVGLSLLASTPAPTPPLHDGLSALRGKAAAYWPDTPPKPHVESFFAASRDLHVGITELRSLIPAATVPIEHGFPFWNVSGAQVNTTQPWGWLGLVPFADPPDPSNRPDFMWMFGRDGSFFNREPFWEDSGNSVIPGGIGVYHVVGQLIMLVRFLDRVALKLGWSDTEVFRVGIVARQTHQRYLADETRSYTAAHAPRIQQPEIEASATVAIGEMRAARTELVVNLVEEFSWQARSTWTRQNLSYIVENAARSHLGPQYAFPPQEQLT